VCHSNQSCIGIILDPALNCETRFVAVGESWNGEDAPLAVPGGIPSSVHCHHRTWCVGTGGGACEGKVQQQQKGGVGVGCLCGAVVVGYNHKSIGSRQTPICPKRIATKTLSTKQDTRTQNPSGTTQIKAVRHKSKR
jgi:hypothetical protein